MSSNQAFFGPPVRNDWMMLCQLAQAMAQNNLAAFNAYLAAYAPVQSTVQKLKVPSPGCWTYTFSGQPTWVVCGSTDPQGAWIYQYLGRALAAGMQGPGNISAGLNALAWQMYNAIINSTAQGSTYVLLGHGVGGALAQIVTRFMLADAQNVQGCYTAGAPSIGDATFAAAIAASTYNLETSGDPVVPLDPLAATVIEGLPNPWNALANMPTVSYAGTGYTVSSTGAVTRGRGPITPAAALQLLVTGSVGNNLLATYLQWLKQGALPSDNQVANAYGYQAPWILYGLNPPSQGGGQTPAGQAQAQQTSQAIAQQICQAECSPQAALSGTVGLGS